MRTPLFIRLAVLILIPCLLQEPITASAAIARPDVWRATLSTDSSFDSQALAPYLFSDGHIPETEAKHLRSEAGELQRSVRTRWRWTKDNLVVLGFLSIFITGAVLDYHFLHALIESSPILERVSLWILGFSGAVSASLIAQWVRIRKGLQEKIEWGAVRDLIILNVAYSAIVEGLLYGQWLNLLPGIAHFSPAWTQWIVDLLGLSLFYSDPAAFFVYGSFLNPKKEVEALKEIHEKLLGFYAVFGLLWAFWLRWALAFPGSPIISFAFIQMGVLSWNVAFEYGRYPDSAALIQKVSDLPKVGRWLAIPLRFVQFVYTHPRYRHFLRHSIPALYIAYGATLLRDLHFSTSVIASFVGLAFAFWVILFQRLMYERSLRETLSLILSWVRRIPRPGSRAAIFWAWLFGAAPLLANVSNSTPSVGGHPWSWLLAAIPLVLMIANGRKEMRLSINLWISEFLSRTVNAVDDWSRRQLMVVPEKFHNFFCALAYQIPEKLTDDWIRRRDFLILLGEVFEYATDPVNTLPPLIYRLPGTVAPKQNHGNKYREHVLLIAHPIDSLTGPAIVHLVYRDVPRFKAVIWRLGPITESQAALYLIRTGWGRKSHIDVERSDRPPSKKRWANNSEQNP